MIDYKRKPKENAELKTARQLYLISLFNLALSTIALTVAVIARTI